MVCPSQVAVLRQADAAQRAELRRLQRTAVAAVEAKDASDAERIWLEKALHAEQVAARAGGRGPPNMDSADESRKTATREEAATFRSGAYPNLIS